MDRIDFNCPFCERPMHAPAGAAGKQGRCKSCRQNVIVPRKPQPEESEPFEKAQRPIVPRWLRTPGMLVGIVLLCGIGWNVSQMTSTEQWTSEDGSTTFTDTYGRWSGKMLHRSLITFNDDGSIDAVAEGPMAPSGSMHGFWKITLLKPSPQVLPRHYWYGDDISEAEWQTRSK